MSASQLYPRLATNLSLSAGGGSNFRQQHDHIMGLAHVVITGKRRLKECPRREARRTVHRTTLDGQPRSFDPAQSHFDCARPRRGTRAEEKNMTTDEKLDLLIEILADVLDVLKEFGPTLGLHITPPPALAKWKKEQHETNTNC